MGIPLLHPPPKQRAEEGRNCGVTDVQQGRKPSPTVAFFQEGKRGDVHVPRTRLHFFLRKVFTFS